MQMFLDQGNKIVKSEDLSKDAFLGGKISLLQPKTGFRAGSDSVLLGASVCENTSHVLDLGSGVGAAALCTLARLPATRAQLVEIDAVYAELAAQNIANNGFADRAHICAFDVTSSGTKREDAGIISNQYTSVIANPPYFDQSAGTDAPHKQRANARAMQNADLDKWARTAAAAAAPKGEIIFIYRASGLTQLLSAFARFGGVTVLPVMARSGHDAGRVLVRGIKGSRAPLVIKSPLVLHEAEGNTYTPQMASILRKGAALHW